MIRRSSGVAARKRPLNHDVRLCFQRNRHGIMDAINCKRRCRKETSIESCAAIEKSEECTWYNGSVNLATLS